MKRLLLSASHSAIALALIAIALPSMSRAETSQGSAGPRPIYRSTADLDISAGNNGADDYRLSWTAALGTSPSNVADPHIVIEVGKYISVGRTSGGHPFWVMSGNMPVTKTGSGKLKRTFTDQGTLDSYKLASSMDANAPHGALQSNGTIMGGSPLFWTPKVGTYYYTCGVPGHDMMVGRIDVVAAASIDHNYYPRPFIQLRGSKRITTSGGSKTLKGITSGDRVRYKYKSSKKYDKNARPNSMGSWKAKARRLKKGKTVRVKLYAYFKNVKSRPLTVRVKRR